MLFVCVLVYSTQLDSITLACPHSSVEVVLFQHQYGKEVREGQNKLFINSISGYR